MDYYDFLTRVVVELPGPAALALVVLGALVAFGGGWAVRRFFRRLDNQDTALGAIQTMLTKELRLLGERVARVEGAIGLKPLSRPDDEA